MSNADAAPSPGPDDQLPAGARTAGYVDEAAQPDPAGDESLLGYDPEESFRWDGEDGVESTDGPDSGEDADFDWVDPDGAATGQPAASLELFAGEEHEARPRRHIGRYAALAGAALVIGAAVVTGPTLWRVYSARHTTLTLPTEVAGMARDSAGDSGETADYLRDAVSSSTSLSSPLGAVYDVGGDAAHSVLIFGGTGSIFRPDHTLGTVLGLLDDDSSDAINDLHGVPAGPLGGTMKCGVSVGSGDGPDPDMPICGWADHGSSVAALFPGRTVEQAADLMLQFRAAIEKK